MRIAQIHVRIAYLFFSLLYILSTRDVTRTLIGGGVYSYIHVLPDEFLFKSNSN